MRQQLAILLLACLAFELSHAWMLKLPKLEDLVEKLEEKKEKELKKLDFLNLFAAKDEKKKENEWDKLKQWFEDKKLKELDFFEGKKEKLEEKLEEKHNKKSSKKNKSKTRPTNDCYEVEATTETSYAEDKYQSEEEEEEEETVLVRDPKPCDCKTSHSYRNSVPTAYDVREDYEEGIRYFT